MSGLNNTGAESLCLVPASVWGAGTAIPSAVCEGKHDFNAKSLHHLSMVCSSTLCFTYLLSSSVGTWLTSVIADGCLPSPVLSVFTLQGPLPGRPR